MGSIHHIFLFLLLLLPITLGTNAAAVTVENVVFADSVTLAGQEVPLRNAVLFTYLGFIKVYVAALYLPEGVGAEQVLADVPKRLEISYQVSIDAADFSKSAAPVLERNLGTVQLAELHGRLNRLNAAYRDVRPGDRYALTYIPGQGTELALNNKPLITIEGADFASAYFGIWLGRDPIDSGLKQQLLQAR